MDSPQADNRPFQEAEVTQTSPFPSHLAQALVEVVRKVAATEILPRFRNLSSADIQAKSGPDDLVTIADRASEEAIGAAVSDLMPEALVIGEEAVAEAPERLERMSQARTAVIIDPVDGTSNFAAGLAVFGVILAVVERGETVFGLLYDPVRDDWVSATRNGGAWFAAPDREPVRLRTRARPAPGRLQGFVPLDLLQPLARPTELARFAPLGPTRALRCSCHEYRTIAFGHADYAVAPEPKPWDHAAGVLVVEEAGGHATVAGRHRYRPESNAGPLVVGSSREVALEVVRTALRPTR